MSDLSPVFTISHQPVAVDRFIAAFSELGLIGEEIADVIWLALKIQQYEPPYSRSNNLPRDQEPKTNDRSSNPIDSPKLIVDPFTPSVTLPPPPSPDSSRQAEIHDSQEQPDGSRNMPIRLPDARSLQEPLTIARALRPLFRCVPSINMVLDEAATIERIAEEQLWTPVLKPDLEPWLELALVVDESKSMLLWQRTIRELQRLLERYGIFRDVRTWGMVIDRVIDKDRQVHEQVRIRPGIGKAARNQRTHSPGELIDPQGRRLVLIATDCVAAHWHDGTVLSVLRTWSESGSTAIIQMLPEWLWSRTALGLAAPVRFRALFPGLPSQRLQAKPLSTWDEIDFETGIQVPIVTLEPEIFTVWAQLVAGKGGVWAPGFVFEPELFEPDEEEENRSDNDLSAEQRVRQFYNSASPMAWKLACLLAAAPIINLPVVRIIQHKKLPKSRQVHTAEVFLGGLLSPSPSLSEITPDTNPDTIRYVFVDGVREALLESSLRSESINVFEVVSQYITGRETIQEFIAYLKDPKQIKDGELQSHPIAQISAQILKQLGGEYGRYAEQLEGVDEPSANEEIVFSVEPEIPSLPELRAALAIIDEQKRTKTLAHLMARSQEAPSNLLHSLSTIENETDRVSALIALIPHLPDTLLSNALEIVRTIQNVFSRFQGLAILATLLPEVVPEALETALEIEDESTLLRALTSVVEKLPSELLPQALKAALTINGASSRARALIALVDKLPDVTPQALKATLEIEDEYFRARVLRELIPHLPSDLLSNVLDAAFAIQQEVVRNDLLRDLIPLLPENLRQGINLVTETPSRTSLWQKGNTQIYALCTSTPWNLPLDALVIPVGYRGGLGNLAAAFQGFLGISSEWLSQAISDTMKANKLKRIKPDQPLLVQLHSKINTQISSLVGSTSERFIICATSESESENEPSSANTSIAYEAVVRLAVEQRFRRIVLPLIGTGVNQLPVDEVATGMLRKIDEVLKSRHTSLEEITIVDHDQDKIEAIAKISRFLSLRKFEFEVVKVDTRGQVISHNSRQAEAFVEDLGSGVELELVKIPAGEFLMGSPDTEAERDNDESPQQLVRVPSFYMGRYAVTQVQWRTVAAYSKIERDLKADPSRFKGDNHPVEQVSWHDVVEFCHRLSQRTGHTYRLPSEAEWEYACRSGTMTPFYFGETLTPDLANYNGNNTYGLGSKGTYRQQTVEVGQFPPNTFGLYDMHGNVWEWCLDYWHDTYEGVPKDGSAWVTDGNADLRRMRGGSWYNDPKTSRSAYRNRDAPDIQYNLLGFRVVCLSP
ncbi:SAV_2336 N-terminal domain-related protein [Nostoc sp.]|uniref:SAV_2336 N-terminal domain-related protein n=1 Tax=Nostoc sp. TaxID=1180 RepID=UPI002FFB42FB